ncbi:MAG: two-component regulator propeller domain-containing protein [Bacteroidia bacterium]
MRTPINYFFTLVLALYFTGNACAQKYNFKNYSQKSGLPNSIVNTIFQDSRGYIWFGTQGGGLSRFDGKTFKNFNKESGLIDNDVTYITEDKDGNIWIATSNGVSRFDGVNFKNFNEKNGLSQGVVYCIYADDGGKIWFAVQGGGVNIYDGRSFTQLMMKDGLPSNNPFTITQDKDHNYWFGMSNGIAKYDGNRVTSYDKVPEVNNKTFFASYLDSKGNIWFGGIEQTGVVKYNGHSFENVALPAEVKDDFIGSIVEDDKNNMWFATNHGVLKMSGDSSKKESRFFLFTEKEGLASNYVLSLCNDYENNIWIGTQDGGVDLFNNQSFANYTEKDGLLNKNVVSIVQETDNTFIIGTSGLGLNVLNTATNTFTPLTDAKEILSCNVYITMFDDKKQLWVGAQEGAFVLTKDGNKYKLKQQIPEKSLVAVLAMIQDKKGTVWLGSYGSGIMKIDNGVSTRYTVSHGFISDKILTIFQDSKSNIWIGTKDQGLIKYNGQSFAQFSTSEGLPDKGVWSIAEDREGNLYLGTNESGVFIFDGKDFKAVNTKNGLCSNYVPKILYDPIDDCIWAGTEKGVNKIKFKKDHQIESIRYFGEQEGYKGIAINANSMIVDTKGLLWFGGINGLSKYDRTYDFPNLTPPKIRFSEIKLGYQSVDWKNYADSVDPKTNLPVNLVLSHKNNNLSFSFQALTTDNVRYTFMLEGQDEDWSPLTNNPEAVFTNIDPGKTYVFKAKVINSNGVWSKEPISFAFTINPPWWRTWWFYTLSVLIIIGSIFSFINFRTAQLAREKKVLEEKVTERTLELKNTHDQLSHAFQDITDSINYAKKIQEAILPLNEEIRKELPDHFILFRPRDVVSGDFYWFNKKGDQVFIAAIDCTGHGVPGAFMSMIGNSLLNEIVSTQGVHDAAGILKKLHLGVRKALKQDRDSYESKDGMDMALVSLNLSMNTLQYAGAKRPMFFVRKGVLEEIKADKQSIGGVEMQSDYQFTNHDFDLQKGDTFYLFTDGYVDQFGGEKGKKYSTKRLRETLDGMQHLPMDDQGRLLNRILKEWKTGLEQIDDVLVIGIRM